MGHQDEECRICGQWIDRSYLPISHENDEGEECEFGPGHEDWDDWLHDTVFCEACGLGSGEGPDGAPLVDIGDGYTVHRTCMCANCREWICSDAERATVGEEIWCRSCVAHLDGDDDHLNVAGDREEAAEAGELTGGGGAQRHTARHYPPGPALRC